MAKQTPEGKVKAKLLTILKELGCWYFMPVQNGMGQSGIPDVVAIVKGRFVGFECKATPKQHPTTLQAMQLQAIKQSGGVAWVVDNESLPIAEKNLREAIREEHYAVGDNLFPDSPLYRWKAKLEPMEFNNGTSS